MRDSEIGFSAEFVELMRNRLCQSFHKYGVVLAENQTRRDHMRSMHKRLALYVETGNTEWLVDAANCLMLEFQYPQHDDAHFRATPTEESPGVYDRERREFNVRHSDTMGGAI